MSGHTPGPWEVRPTRADTQEVFAAVNIGTDEEGGILQPIYDISLHPSLMVGRDDGLVYAMLTYESYRQFPSVDFKEMQRANARLIAAAPDLLEAAKAAVEYDKAIRSCADDPDKMSSHCTADGDDLDTLYFRWMTASRAAIAKAEGGAP